MSAFSDYAENAIIGHMLRGTAMAVPSKVYVALFTADPTDAGTGPEVTTAAWPAYARQDAAQGGTNASGWTAPSNGACANAKAISFPEYNGASPLTITHFALFDAPTGGNMLLSKSLNQSKTIDTNDVFSLKAGAIQVAIA